MVGMQLLKRFILGLSWVNVDNDKEKYAQILQFCAKDNERMIFWSGVGIGECNFTGIVKMKVLD